VLIALLDAEPLECGLAVIMKGFTLLASSH